MRSIFMTIRCRHSKRWRATRQTSGAVFDLAARICGAPAEYAAERAGAGLWHHRCCCAPFALHASRRQLFVPLEWLENGVTPEEAFAGQSSPFLIDALGQLRTRARENLSAFESLLPQLPAVTMPAFLPVALVPAISR
jgi:phytoene/squalene synthetase